MSQRKPKPPVEHGKLVDFLVARTGAAAAKYKDALKPRPKPKLTKKAAALQALVDADNLGFQNATVASAFAILTGEPIQPRAPRPCIASEDITPGICVLLNKADHPFPQDVVLITTRDSFYNLMRTDTGNLKDSSISTDLTRFRFATPAEIRAAMEKVPTEKAEVLTWALLRS